LPIFGKTKAANAAFFLTNLRVFVDLLGLIFCLIFHSFHALNQRLIAWVYVAHEYLFGLQKKALLTRT